MNVNARLDHLIPINNVCNQKCFFCSAADRMEWWEPIPMKDIMRDIMIRENYIQISWWEPLLHPKVFDIIYFIRKYKPWCFVEFQTNGVYLLKNNNLWKLLKLKVDLFNVNYPCHIESVNDDIAGMKGSFQPREEAMLEVISQWGNLRINIIVNTKNYIYLPEMVQYIWGRFPGLERIQFSFTKAMGAAKESSLVIPRYEESESFFIGALGECEKQNIIADVDHIPMCFLGRFYKNHVDYHKMKNNESWIFQIEKNYVSKCSSCDKRKYCSWYRKDYLEVYDCR